MSHALTKACWPLQMPPTSKSVLMALADCANGEDNFCWPSIPTVAVMTCFSERAIQNAIKWLEDTKIVVADRSNGRHTKYFLTPENFTPSAAKAAPTPAPAAPVPPQEIHGYPRTTCTTTPAANAPLPPQEMHQPPHLVRQPPQEVPSNRKEPERTVKSLKPRAEKISASDFSAPDWVPAKAWSDYIEMRIEKKKEPTVRAAELVIAELQKLSKAGHDVEAVLNQSTRSGWTDVYPLKGNAATSNRPGPFDMDAINAENNRKAKQMLFGNQGEFLDA